MFKVMNRPDMVMKGGVICIDGLLSSLSSLSLVVVDNNIYHRFYHNRELKVTSPLVKQHVQEQLDESYLVYGTLVKKNTNTYSMEENLNVMAACVVIK